MAGEESGISPDIPPKAPTPWAAFGNAATPQRHEQSQAPFVVVPVPDTMPVPAVAAEAVGGATEAAEAAGGAAEEEPPVMAFALPVPFCAMAICSNMAWVLFAVGLMEKVMPFPQ